jgi:hypothetical protein
MLGFTRSHTLFTLAGNLVVSGRIHCKGYFPRFLAAGQEQRYCC